ncbi:MAG: hypothetical protein EOO05_07035 [Chitinophagaceae bacterium]|nr:MAG: hypothetical protein EOO05_07035 [Chitinophagaceae bacterium]
MEDNYRNDDFEQYVRGQADQHRMFPSEKVWNAVDSALHPRKKWYGFGLAFLLLLTGSAVTWVMSTYPVAKPSDLAVSGQPGSQASTEKQETAEQPDLKTLSPFTRQTSTPHITRFKEPVPGPEVGLSARESLLLTLEEEDAGMPSSLPTDETRRNQLTVVHSVARTIPAQLMTSVPVLPVDDEPLAILDIKTTADKKQVVAELDLLEAPASIESVVNSYKAPAKKVSWQFFVTPTISNRRLSSNKAFRSMPDPLGIGGSSNFPFATTPDVNNAVTHKPDVGLQIGFTARYPISRNVRITGGFQFNLNRYDIKAFLNNGEVARIELDGSAAPVSTWSSYRSQGVSRLDWLKNIYFSVSAPIGAEFILFRNRKASNAFGIAGTIQPTYVIRNKAYLISTDYKNYAKVPWLVRDANVSTGFEAFVQHNKGKTEWQIGPQARYQLLSSFNKKYPIRENLFDFGVKFGITLNK